MKNAKDTFESAKDKVAGEIKEAAGKVTGNEELELKGKLQSATADLKQDVKDLTKNVKEGIAEKVNDMIDKQEK
ncbi:MAG: CsbD family protein [Actinobacteria bacterium]|nr:CsbD family protein [Actinomycetota bacterium]